MRCDSALRVLRQHRWLNNELSPQFIQALTAVYKPARAGFIEPAYDVVVGDESLTHCNVTLVAFHGSAPWLHLGCAMYLVGAPLRYLKYLRDAPQVC